MNYLNEGVVSYFMFKNITIVVVSAKFDIWHILCHNKNIGSFVFFAKQSAKPKQMNGIKHVGFYWVWHTSITSLSDW